MKMFLDDYVLIDNLNVSCHWKDGVSDEYIFDRPKVFRGYMASFLIIKYIDEVYGRTYLYELMKDNKKISNSLRFKNLRAFSPSFSST